MKTKSGKSKSQPKTTVRYTGRPSAFTLFRHQIYDQAARQVMLEMHQRVKEHVWERDRGAVKRIAAAENLEELLDLAPLAAGLGLDAWEARLLDFQTGDYLQKIANRLNEARAQIKNRDARAQVYKCLIRALRWSEKPGAEVLLACFGDLDDHGKGLASVALGLLKETAAADRIWEFYQQQAKNKPEHTQGALWGMIDLEDGRAIPALVAQLHSGRWNYELFGWLSMRGDTSTVVPLLRAIVLSPQNVRVQPMMALIGVVKRVGRATIEAEVQNAFQGEAHADEVRDLMELLYSQPASLAEEHFETFYHGLTRESVKSVIDRL